MDKEVNYRNKKRYNTRKYPLRQRGFWVWVIWLLSKIALIGKKYEIKKIGMEELKPPYIILSNHMHFVDFELAAMATTPQPVSNIVSIEGYILKIFLLEWIGAIATRRFTTDIHLVKAIRKVLQNKGVVLMYPEARYTPCGTTSFMPDSLGKLIRMNKVPVAIIKHHGNHLHAPFWNFRKKRKVKMTTVLRPILTAEQVQNMSVEEINAVIKKELSYDEYRYQKENGIKITEKHRAEGLHKVLYQCPHCKTEFKMDSKGSEIFCTACGKRWLWQEDGYLKALSGETEFDHIPDWFEWERKQVIDEIDRGEYSFSDEVEVYSLPKVWWFTHLGKGKITHDPQSGFVLEGFYRGQDYRITRKPAHINSLHVEYAFGPLKWKDYIDISTENDSFYCAPTKENVITKLAFATEELFRRSRIREKRTAESKK